MNKAYKKSYHVTNPFRFFIFVFIIVFGIIMASMAIFDSSSSKVSASNTSYKVVRITDGDNLWSIIKTYNGSNVNLRESISEVCKINNIKAGDIKPGDMIKIPIYNEE